MNKLKYLQRFKKKETNTKLVSEEWVVMDKDEQIKGAFQKQTDAIKFANSNNYPTIYQINVYSITIKTQI